MSSCNGHKPEDSAAIAGLRRIRIHHRDPGSFTSGVPEPDLITRQERDLDQRGENGGEDRQKEDELDG